MNMEIEKEKINTVKMVQTKTETVIIEGDCIVPDSKPDIISSISTSGNVCIYKKEVLDGKVRMDGCINTYIMYFSEAEEEAVRGLGTGLDFTQVFDVKDCVAGMDLEIATNVKGIECKILNGRKVSLRAEVEFKIDVFSTEDAEILKEIKEESDIQKLNKCLKINSLVGRGTNKAYAKDTLTIDNTDNMVEILKSEITIINRDFKISYNKVLAKADCHAKILYLTEDNRIGKVEGNIPVMGFIDINGIAEDNVCDMRYLLKNVILKPNDMAEHSIYVEAEVEFSCRVYEIKEVNVIQDLYSPNCDMKFTQKLVNVMTEMKVTRDKYSMQENVAIPEMDGNQIYDISVNPCITDMQVNNDKIHYEGNIRLQILFASSNSIKVDRKEVELPISYDMLVPGICPKNAVHTEIEVKEPNFVVMAGGTIECKIEMELEAKTMDGIQMNMIDNLEMEESREVSMYSMIIYFVKSGDTLWNIAKKFKSTVEDIVRVNEIEDENKIYPGQQLFIPRYVARRIESA